ncbi:hypothetical protein ACT7WR_005271, partial [Salmonella enterica subsp. enterica serovar Newport]
TGFVATQKIYSQQIIDGNDILCPVTTGRRVTAKRYMVSSLILPLPAFALTTSQFAQRRYKHLCL